MSHWKTIWGFVVKPSWPSVGNLNIGRIAGPFYVYTNNGLATAYWNYGGRQSDWHTPYYTTTTTHTSECEAAMASLTKQNSHKNHWVSSHETNTQQAIGDVMKTYKIAPLDIDAARKGLESWLSNGSGKKNAFRIEREHGSKENLLSEIAGEIASRTLTFRPIRRYNRLESTNGKIRVIGIESVKQQVCDHIACVALEPLLSAKVGFYQVASVKGKGQSMCRRVLKKWVKGAKYHVKLDVRKCYQSTPHEVVMRILKKYVKGDDILYLCSALLSTYQQGLEIGSHFSLRIMQLVLSFAYHEVEGMGKLRRNRWKPLICHQIWYMDDILLIGTDKDDVKVATRRLERYMHDELGLTLKPWKIAKTSRTESLDLGGWVVSVGRCALRGTTFLNAMRAFRKFVRASSPKNAKSFIAYWGWIVNGNCERLRINKGIDKAKAHAASVISFQDRLENQCRLHPTPSYAG